MNTELKAKWLQHMLKKNEKQGCFNALKQLMFGAGILVAIILPSFPSQLLAQATPVEPPTQSTQKPNTPPDSLGRELLRQLLQCMSSNTSSPKKPSVASVQAASMQCFFKVVMLAPDGSIRPDSSDRLTALVKLTGISTPQPVSQGQASLKLKHLAKSQVFTVPVIIEGQPKTFLFDTGASSSRKWVLKSSHPCHNQI